MFTNPPAWTTTAVPGFRGHFWAPDVLRVNHASWLYYSVSTWGSQTSVIGLATNATLNPEDSRYRWADAGPVIRSHPRENFNAIDPSVLLDAQGRLWLTFGSYWSGIKLVQLNPETGLRLDTNTPPAALAWKEAIEAACLWQHADYYYLFANWGRCCQGVDSTYNIRVGRSREAAGPFLDHDGRDLLRGGGTLLLQTEGRYIGPGHAGVLVRGQTNWLSFHYYDAKRFGTGTLGLRQLRWSPDGWPEW